MRLTRRDFIALAGAAAAASAAPRAAAQAGWPDRPIRMVIGYTAGGAADQVARILATRLEKLWGQSIVMDYRPGAGAALAAELTSRAAPDGYTLHLTDSGPLTIGPNLRKVPYDPVAGFTPLAYVGGAGLAVLVHPSVPANDLQGLVRLLKSNADKYSYSTSGVGSPHHLAAELFKSQAGVEMTHVPYKGAAAAMADLLAGQIPISFATIGPAIPHVRAGKVRALAVTAAARSLALPEVPTIAEQGLPGYDAKPWFVVVAPPNLPPALAERLQSGLRTAVTDPDVMAALQKLGTDTGGPATPQQVTELIRADLAKWGAIIKRANISVDS